MNANDENLKTMATVTDRLLAAPKPKPVRSDLYVDCDDCGVPLYEDEVYWVSVPLQSDKALCSACYYDREVCNEDDRWDTPDARNGVSNSDFFDFRNGGR